MRRTRALTPVQQLSWRVMRGSIHLVSYLLIALQTAAPAARGSSDVAQCFGSENFIIRIRILGLSQDPLESGSKNRW